MPVERKFFPSTLYSLLIFLRKLELRRKEGKSYVLHRANIDEKTEIPYFLGS